MIKQNRIFAMICLVSAISLAVYILWAKTRSEDNTSDAPKSVESVAEAAASTCSTTDAKPLPASRLIFFRYNGAGSHYGKLAFAPYERLDQPQFIETLSCEAAYVAGGRGICLAANYGLITTYDAKL